MADEELEVDIRISWSRESIISLRYSIDSVRSCTSQWTRKLDCKLNVTSRNGQTRRNGFDWVRCCLREEMYAYLFLIHRSSVFLRYHTVLLWRAILYSNFFPIKRASTLNRDSNYVRFYETVIIRRYYFSSICSKPTWNACSIAPSLCRNFTLPAIL